MIILKFGGASLQDAGHMRHATGYIKHVKDKNPIVIVSAMKGVTDRLIKGTDVAVAGERKAVEETMEKLHNLHTSAIVNLISDRKLRNECLDKTELLLGKLSSLYRSIAIIGEATDRSRDYICLLGKKCPQLYSLQPY